jgi:hypothetical protein
LITLSNYVDLTYNVQVTGQLFVDEFVFPVERIFKIFRVRQVADAGIVQAVKHLVSCLGWETMNVGER